MFAYTALSNDNPDKFNSYIIWDVISNVYFHITTILCNSQLNP